MNRPEQALQVQAIQYLRIALPNAVIWHCPNGGARTEAEGRILKAMGVLAGVADIQILAGGRSYFIELKIGNGDLTPSQVTFRANCELQGVPHAVCRSLAEVEGTVAAWALNPRGRIAA